ncbi:tyrosine-type recombinase/integrase [Arcanobacterium phocae]|uniref:tyrosine-type recombinase/integrase n=1 Tax=Arcanobacterium phocae TaxID=131112 RepID=UPI001C0EE123|nr:site-specific integrase [Arcanobacterium phocae]
MARAQAFGDTPKTKNGKYRARYIHPDQPYKTDGKRNYINAPTTFTTKTAARSWLAQVKADIERGLWKSPEQLERERVEAERRTRAEAYTFGEYVRASWLPTRAWKHSTRRAEEARMDNHVLPRWGNVPLKQITTLDIRHWLSVLSPGSPGARKKSYELFRSVILTAFDDELLDHNPCTRGLLGKVKAPECAKPGKGHERSQRAITWAQLEAIADEVPQYMSLLVRLSGLLGLRSGEARALTGGDCILYKDKDGVERMQISINKAISGQGENLRLDTPKTASSVRVLEVPTALVPEMIERAQQVGVTGIMFHASNDRRSYLPESTYQINLKRAAKRVGIESLSPHDFRRTAITNMLDIDIPQYKVQAVVGHTTPHMTLRYAKATQERNAQAVDQINSAFEASKNIPSLDAKRREHENQNNTTSQQAK